MKIAYIRVNSTTQHTIRQEILMQELGAERIYIDIQNGKDAERPKLKEMMRFVRQGDIVIVESINRFARNTRDLLELVDKLMKIKVQFICKKESIDSETPSGKFILTVFAALAELERDYILDRQREGITVAKKNIHPGRVDEVFKEWKAGIITGVDAMHKLNMTRTKFYQRAIEMGWMNTKDTKK